MNIPAKNILSQLSVQITASRETAPILAYEEAN